MKLPEKPSAEFFTANREKVMKRLEGGLLVVSGYTLMQRTNDEEAPFIQEGAFWWLCGVEFPDWWLIIDSARSKSWLVEPTIDETHRLFSESLLQEDAGRASGITEVLSNDEAVSMLRRAAKSRTLVYTVGQPSYFTSIGFSLNPAAKNVHDILSRTFSSVREFRHEIADLRAIKQPDELKWMQSAIDLTTGALEDVRKNIQQFRYEYEIEAELGYTFRKQGASGHAFDPIVASGANSSTIHYFSNNARLKKGTLIMMDVGARVNGFAADLTRTYAYGKPTKRMIEVHAAVQNAQRQIIALLRPGLFFSEYHDAAAKIVRSSMVDAKLISSISDTDGFHRHMAHQVGHGLGIDVHESLGRFKMIEPGMVLTVEPGMYSPAEKFGVRIEDDILITENGHKNLSAKLSTDLI